MSAPTGLRRSIAKALVHHAARRLAPSRAAWAEAMRHEVDSLDDDANALRWAIGCVVASYSERISPMKTAAFSPLFGIAALTVFVFGGYFVAGGDMKPLTDFVPLISIMVVLGAGAASSILTTVGGQGILESISRSLQGRRFCREDYRSVMAVLVAVLNDKAPALTGRVYPILYNTDVAQMIGDAKALLERHQISADHLGAVLQSRIDTIVTDQRRAVRILNAVRLSLLWFGALAFLLGAMRPLISLTEPPEVVGGMLAQALSAPLLGVFLAAGVFQPLARRIEAAITDDAHVYQVIRMAFYCRAAGSETELAVRAAFGSLPTEFSMDQSEFDAAAASV